MPILFGTAIVLAVVGLLALVVALVSNDTDTRMVAKAVTVIGFVLAICCTIGSSANSVPVRSVGIVTSFNKPTGEVTGSGLKWVAPWEKVGEWDAGRQRYDHLGKGCVNVRIASLANACVETLVEWQVKPGAAPEQFMAYKGNFQQMVDTRINVNLTAAMNDAFATYSPLAKIDQTTGNLNVDIAPYVTAVKTKAEGRLGSEIDILSVSITRVNHDDKTEANIKAFQDKLAEARNLTQDKVNAELRKQITEKNAQVDKVTRCLEIAEKTNSNPGLCINPGIVMGSSK